MTHPHHKSIPHDFMRELVRRAKLQRLNESDVAPIFNCDVGYLSQCCKPHDIGDTFICDKHLSELKERLK